MEEQSSRNMSVVWFGERAPAHHYTMTPPRQEKQKNKSTWKINELLFFLFLAGHISNGYHWHCLFSRCALLLVFSPIYHFPLFSHCSWVFFSLYLFILIYRFVGFFPLFVLSIIIYAFWFPFGLLSVFEARTTICTLK